MFVLHSCCISTDQRVNIEMAQMPPKAPNWPDFTHHKLLSMELASNPNSNSSWVDEFLDFSSAKRGSHRRSCSDSVAFLEMPMEECRARSCVPGSGSNNTSSGFGRFDDEQLMSMFNDDVPAAVGLTMSCSNPPTPSDHNSFNGEDKQNGPSSHDLDQLKQLKSEPEEVQSSCKTDGQVTQPTTTTTFNTNNDNSGEKIVDPKRIKRILANRQSAQRSRVRKLHYISELERSVTSLQAEVSVLSPRVAFLDHQRMVLTVDNGVLKQRIAALAQDKIFKDAHQEALKREIERLRQIHYQQQNMKKMENGSSPHQSKSPQAPFVIDANAPAEKDQLVN